MRARASSVDRELQRPARLDRVVVGGLVPARAPGLVVVDDGAVAGGRPVDAVDAAAEPHRPPVGELDRDRSLPIVAEGALEAAGRGHDSEAGSYVLVDFEEARGGRGDPALGEDPRHATTRDAARLGLGAPLLDQRGEPGAVRGRPPCRAGR